MMTLYRKTCSSTETSQSTIALCNLCVWNFCHSPLKQKPLVIHSPCQHSRKLAQHSKMSDKLATIHIYTVKKSRSFEYTSLLSVQLFFLKKKKVPQKGEQTELRITTMETLLLSALL